MKSIRSSTTWLTFIAVSLLGIVACSSAYWVAKQLLVKNFDQDLLIEFKNVSGVSRVWPDGDFYVDIDFDLATQFNIGGSRLFQIWSAGEELGDYLEVIDRSPMLEQLDIDLPYPVSTIQIEPYFYDFTFPDGQPARAVFKRISAPLVTDETSFDTENDVAIDIVVARERHSLDESIAALFQWMFIIAALIPVLSFIVVYYAIGLGMAPLKRLTRKMSIITTSGESIATDNSSWPQEITPVIDTFNQLLNRLEKGMQRERRFTGDLAHEMRTPLAELRLVTDIALRADSKERLVTAVQQVNTISHSIADLVNAMLLLTRVQSRTQQLILAEVDLVLLFRQQCERIQKRAVERGIDIIKDIPKALIINTDLALLSTIFSNLINNAIEHAPENTNILLSLKNQELGFQISVSNVAPNLEKSDLKHLKTPFWCKETSRQSSHHFGLGLAIVQEVIVCLNLKLDITLTENKCLTFTCHS